MIEIGTQITHSKRKVKLPEVILFTTNLKKHLKKLKEEDHLVYK
jgi:hypothetical protein